jgi:hypothetical protein
VVSQNILLNQIIDIKNMKDNWNKNDWQGRSRENVETSYEVAGISMFGCVCMIVDLVIYNLVVHGI